MLALSADKRTELKSTDRSFAKTGILHWSDGGRQYEFFNGSTRSIPANVIINGTMRNPYQTANKACPQYHVQVDEACYFDYTSTVYIYPETKRGTFMASGEWALNDNHTLFADFLYGKQSTVSKIAPPPVDIKVNPTDAAFSHVAPLGATSAVTARWRVMDAGNRTTDNTNVAYQLAGGAKGRLMDWDYHTSFTHSISKATESHLAGWLMADELKAAIASGTLDPFVGPGQQSAAGMTALNSAIHRGVYKEGQNSITMLETRASKPIFALTGGDAALGVGADMRFENTRYNPSLLAQGKGGTTGSNVIAGDSGADIPFDVNRRAVGAFAELAMPVLKSLEVTGALRADRYSDFGNTVNGKLSGRWTPVQQFMMRGSVGTGFHAPTAAQVYGPRLQSYGVTGGTYDCPFTAPDALAAYCLPAGSQYNVFGGSNPDLKPEKSQQWTLGFRVEPANWLSAGLDVWNVKVKDRIGQLSEDTIMADPVKYKNNFTHTVDPVSGDDNLAIVQLNQNLGNSITRGIDFDVRTRFNTGIGRISSNLIATYMLKDDYQREPGGQYYSDLGKYNDGGVLQRFIGRWSNSLQIDNWSTTFSVNYKSGYWDQPQTVTDITDSDPTKQFDVDNYTRKVKPFITFDLQASYKFKWGASDISATLGVLNLTDKAPPFSIKTTGGHQLGYDNRYADPRGRTIYGTLTAKFF